MITADEALVRLKDGNQRFATGVRSDDTYTKQMQRPSLINEQTPFAIILGCSDSRVPAEIVFDQGLGDLFVIRVAGNIVAPSQIGSIEFAAERFGTKLVVVMGHSKCGAVTATLDDLRHPSSDGSMNLMSIVSRIRPAVEPLYNTNLRNDPDLLLEAAIKANIMASTNQLRRGSKVLENLILNNELMVVGAEYSLETGMVEFFEGI
ncbi:carbonic anhydrase [Leucothrix mucor]|uniref:carbonic anhydrase n=1 Tax=Leucothrix mucor TaxID=45248 RepID=UPI0003B4EEB7|nr:carbonic anhydrase [Leucothrix mucor]